MIWLELLIVLVCIFVGARLGGIALGTVAGIGLAVLVFLLGLPPGVPPRTVLGMILAVITAAATMQAAGGLDYLVRIADRALRIWPAGITLVAPMVAYVLTLAAGTGHIIYALLPVIAEVSRNAGVRPRGGRGGPCARSDRATSTVDERRTVRRGRARPARPSTRGG